MFRVETSDPLLFGHDPAERLIAAERVERNRGGDQMALSFREGAAVRRVEEPFHPFILLESAALITPFKGEPELRELSGAGRLKTLAAFASWKECLRARAWLSKQSGSRQADPGAPFLFLSDPVHQHLVTTGRTSFKGMALQDLVRMQIDIECFTAPGFEFCNPDRQEDRIIVIAVGDSTGRIELISGTELDEREMLLRLAALVRERDPDVIEGHNIFNFDLPYLVTRAARHGVDLAIGRDGSVPRQHPSRFSAGERTIAYSKFEVFGRHIVDTLFLAHAYDISHRTLEGLGLKEVARHFGVAARDRTHIEGSRISETFRSDPERLLAYARADIAETAAIAEVLSSSNFVQAQMLPYAYQNVCVRGSATKIDALLLREYLRQGHAIPTPGEARPFEGGYTDLFVQGVVRNVHHCDVRSLYPSLMLTQHIVPRSDELGVFERLLDALRTVRIEAKARMKASAAPPEQKHLDAVQTAFKVLINSFYGYLGFSQGRFCDFDAAERVASEGRALLRRMIAWLEEHGARPVEIDTDGIYFLPPVLTAPGQVEQFRAGFQQALPEGIEVEFDGEYEAMFSYKMKNYALLTREGDIVMKGAALKSRGLEPFQRAFLEEAVRLMLEGRGAEMPRLKAEYGRRIGEREWPIRMLARTETLQDSPETYAGKIGQGDRGRGAAYELALRSGRPYRAGDQISYYVTGNKKSVAAHASAKLVSEWNPDQRDENIPYYMAKLDALYAKLVELSGGEATQAQGELEF